MSGHCSRQLVLLLILILLGANVGLTGKERLFSKDIVLDNDCVLKVRETIAEAVSIKLFCTGRLVQRAGIPSADIRDENIQKVIFTGNVQAYFLTAWDRYSTYGAQTNVIIWKCANKWALVEAPFTRGFAEDRDKDGVFELIDYYPTERMFRFDNGRFIEIKK